MGQRWLSILGKKGTQKGTFLGWKVSPSVGHTGSGRRFEASAGLEVASSATNHHPHTLRSPRPKPRLFGSTPLMWTGNKISRRCRFTCWGPRLLVGSPWDPACGVGRTAGSRQLPWQYRPTELLHRLHHLLLTDARTLPHSKTGLDPSWNYGRCDSARITLSKNPLSILLHVRQTKTIFGTHCKNNGIICVFLERALNSHLKSPKKIHKITPFFLTRSSENQRV